MALTEAEAKPGAVAYFTIDALRGDSDVERTGGSPDGKPRPFLCYATDAAGRTYWTPLTTAETQGKRTLIDAKWITNATGRLATDLVLVNDGGHTYRAQPAVMVRLSASSDHKNASNRPWVSPAGVSAALAAVQGRDGLAPT